jgi:hypothetical protein
VRVKTGVVVGALVAVLAVVAAGCSSGGKPHAAVADASGSACPKAWASGWAKLANRVRAEVYCPRWMPDPLTGRIGGPWNNIDSVGRDRSYLIGFVWQEQNGEKHVNFRGYPGRTRIPTCIGEDNRSRVPCFSDPAGRKRVGGIDATLYTVNHGADQWHLLYAWRHDGSLYTVSQHVAPPLSYRQVRQNLVRILRSLVLVRPEQT